MKKSELYKIIREEIEVVLTNEEAVEMFDLDMSALLDEMTTVSTNDLYLAEMFDTGGAGVGGMNLEQTIALCKKAGGEWLGGDPETGAQGYCSKQVSEAEDKSFSKAAKEIEKKGTEGVFTAKAKKAGMGVQAYAAKVLKKGSKASTKTKRQAAFAKGAATVARENK